MEPLLDVADDGVAGVAETTGRVPPGLPVQEGLRPGHGGQEVRQTEPVPVPPRRAQLRRRPADHPGLQHLVR